MADKRKIRGRFKAETKRERERETLMIPGVSVRGATHLSVMWLLGEGQKPNKWWLNPCSDPGDKFKSNSPKT